MIVNYIYVSIGAAVGGLLRYLISDIVQKNSSVIFPYSTLAVNVIGSFLLGFIMFYLGEKELISNDLRLLLSVGVCGGFTTFSTFSYETLILFRESEFMMAGINVPLNVVLSLATIYAAYILSKI